MSSTMKSEKALTSTSVEASSSRPDDAPCAIHIDPEAEARLLRKLDLRICPVLFLLYFLCFLDRSNIGNAKIQGMTQDLDLDHGNRYNVALFVFFISYILFEAPSNLVLKKSRPSFVLAGLVFGWGMVNMAMGLVQNFASLAVLRFLLGVFEAGLWPGIVYYTSMFYRRHEFQKRIAAIWSASLVASASSGFLAYAIGHMSGVRGYGGWRWIFIIEGSMTAAIGLVSVFFIVDFPDQVTFLTAEEKELLAQRLKADNELNKDRMTRQYLIKILMDYKIYMAGLVVFSNSACSYSMSAFMPTILKDLGWTSAEAQLHTIPVYMVALVFLGLGAWASDRLKHRCAFIVAPIVVATVGYGMLLGQQELSSGTKYFAVFLAEFAGYSSPLIQSWLMNNTVGHYKRAIASAMANGIGNLSGLIVSNVFFPREEPRYTTGYSVTLACILLTPIACGIMEVALYRENKRRDRGERDWRLQLPADEVAYLADEHPKFRYTL